MRRCLLVYGSLLIVVCGSLPLSAAERVGPAAEKVTTLSPTGIRNANEWLTQLDDDDYFVREKATQKLTELGPAGIQLISQTLKSGSPEAAWRAGAAMEQIALSGDEAALKAVTVAFEDVMKSARPGLVSMIKELADRQQWYRHARAVEQIARHGGQIQVSEDGEGVEFGGLVELDVALDDIDVEDRVMEPAFVDGEDPFSLELDAELGKVDDATRFRLAGVEPIEISFLDQFKEVAGKPLATSEVAFAGLIEALEMEGGGLLEKEAEFRKVMEAKIAEAADADDAVEVGFLIGDEEELGEEGGEFQAALTIGKNWKGGDAGLALLKDIRGLQMVKFEDSPLTDAALTQLEKVKELSAVYIVGGSFSPEALMKFRRTRPMVTLSARGKGMLGINATGIRIEFVQDNSPAAKAGIKKGDVVRRVAGQEVEDFVDITLTLVSRMPGDKIEIEIERSGEVQKLEVQLAERK